MIDPVSSNANFIVAETLVDGVVVPMREGLPTGISGLIGRLDLVRCDLIAIDGQDVSFLGISQVGFLPIRSNGFPATAARPVVRAAVAGLLDHSPASTSGGERTKSVMRCESAKGTLPSAPAAIGSKCRRPPPCHALPNPCSGWPSVAIGLFETSRAHGRHARDQRIDCLSWSRATLAV